MAKTPQRRLLLNTRANARRTLARVIRDFDRDPAADAARFRATVHALSVLLAFDKAAEADELADRLAAIEARLEAAGR